MNKINPELSIRGDEVGFCYIIAVNSHQKIGQSVNVDGVIANARRFDASARLLTCWPCTKQSSVEAIVHSGLKKWRTENEQFKMPEEVIQWIASLCDREFGQWVWETGADDRAIGWEFPRVYMNGKTRVWPCVYFPKPDVVAWAMVVSELKPEYSTLEKMWFQNPSGFNSAWLGRPQKFGGARPTDPDLSNARSQV